MTAEVERIGVDAVSEWTALLLVPFLVIGAIALVAALITLAARRRSLRTMHPVPPQPEPHWQGAPVEPLVERRVEPHQGHG